LGIIDPAQRRGPSDPNEEGVYAVVTITDGDVEIRIVGRYDYDQTIADLQDRIEDATAP
jgi:hypothetical protein